MSTDGYSSSDGESSPERTPQPATQRTISAALNAALDRVEALTEGGHIDEYAHNEIAKALKGINDVETRSTEKLVTGTIVMLASDDPAVLDSALATKALSVETLSSPKFLRELFRCRLAREPQPCKALDPEWTEYLLEFYVRPIEDEGEGASHTRFRPQRNIIMNMVEALSNVVPSDVRAAFVDELVKYMRKVDITVYTLVNTKEEDRDEYNETTAWLEEVLLYAPGLEQWAVPEADKAKWAEDMRQYLHDLRCPPDELEIGRVIGVLRAGDGAGA